MVVLLVLFMIISFLTIDYFVTRAERRRGIVATPRRSIRSVARRARLSKSADPAELPGGLFVSPGHVWMKVEPSGTVSVGVDRVMLSLIGGEVDCVYGVPVGSTLHDGGPLIMLRNGHRALKIRSPLSGVISEVNDRVRRAPWRIVADPFEAGWLYRVSPSGLSGSLKNTRVAEDAAAWVRGEVARLRDLVHACTVGDVAQRTMADGGQVEGSFPDALENREWEELVERYFSRDQVGVTAHADPTVR